MDRCLRRRLSLCTSHVQAYTLAEAEAVLVTLLAEQEETLGQLPADSAEYLTDEIAACKAAIILLGGEL